MAVTESERMRIPYWAAEKQKRPFLLKVGMRNVLSCEEEGRGLAGIQMWTSPAR